MQGRSDHAQQIDARLPHGLQGKAFNQQHIQPKAFALKHPAASAGVKARTGHTWLGLLNPSSRAVFIRLIRRLTAKVAAGHSTQFSTARMSAQTSNLQVSASFFGQIVPRVAVWHSHSPAIERSIHSFVSVSPSALPSCFNLQPQKQTALFCPCCFFDLLQPAANGKPQKLHTFRVARSKTDQLHGPLAKSSCAAF